MMSEPISDPVTRTRLSFDPEGENMIVTLWMEPGGGLPPHYHPQQEERWSVVEGTVRLRLGNDERVIGPEDGEIPVQPGTVHGFESVSDQEAKLRCLVVPALHIQNFLEEAAAAGREGLFTPRGNPRGLRGMRWAAQFLKRYRDETVMVSPPQFVQRGLIALFARGS
jgi:quercetin dioxygenase-like cupin family protein